MPASNIPSVLGTFIDGTIVTAGTTATGDTGGSTLNPKMELIRNVVNDHATRIDSLTSQVSGLGGLVYNVVSYGADPTGVNNSTTAIQNAINDAVTNQGIVVFSNGTYKITATLNVSGTCYITSDGAGQGVTIFQTTPTQSFFNITSSYVRITDLKFDFQGTSATNAMIYRSTVGVYVTGIVIQRCQFYSSLSRSFTAISIASAQASLFSDCSVTGSATSTVNFISLSDPVNVSISRNICTSCGTAVNISSIAGTPSNVVIDTNTISTIYADAISLGYCSNIFIDKNLFSNFRSTTTVYYAVKIVAGPGSRASCISITSNTVNNNGSASSIKNGGFYVRSSEYLNISSNNFIYGFCPIYITGLSSSGTSSNNINISDNMLQRPYDGGIYIEDFYQSCVVKGNIIVDVISNTAPVNASAIRNASTSTLSNCMVVSNNSVATQGTTGYTNINSYGYTTSGSLTQRTMMQGNDFVITTQSPVSISAYYTIFYEDVTGDRIFNANTAAPTTGTWKVGDKVILDTPSAGGYIGYVCTTAGTPGTWKGFGAIQA